MDKIFKFGPLVMVVALSVKAVISSVSPADAAIAVTLVGLLAAREHLNRNIEYKEFKESTEAQVKALDEIANKKLEEMSKAITKQNEVIKVQAEEYAKLRDSMSGIKLQFGAKEAFTQNKVRVG